MKKLLICLLALLLAAAPALGEDLPSWVTDGGDAAREPLEGPGFGSAEEAVTAYLEAMKNGDVEGMLATFAIETYVDEGDPLAYLTRIKTFFPGSAEGLPTGDPYLRELAVACRYADLVERLCQQYLFFSWPQAYGDFNGGGLVLREESEVEAFLEALSASTFSSALAEAELVEFVDPATLLETYASPANQELLAKLQASYGCDELTDVVARLDVGGEEWYQCMQCARYGERWYNLSQRANIANLLGLDSFAAGLFFPSGM